MHQDALFQLVYKNLFIWVKLRPVRVIIGLLLIEILRVEFSNSRIMNEMALHIRWLVQLLHGPLKTLRPGEFDAVLTEKSWCESYLKPQRYSRNSQ